MHRYAQATFHEGTHRLAPGDSTPWRDTSSPINRLKGWWLAPAAKGSVIAAWCVTFVIATYCFTIQQDAKGTYLLNNVLLRNLHEETQRADASEQRASSLQDAMRQMFASEKKKHSNLEKLEQYRESGEKIKAGLVNYELELSRERARADTLYERNQNLIVEMTRVRQEMTRLKSDNETLTHEIDKLRKLVRRAEA
ncbi:hypothetical protein STCU_02166 [Strigomonas culicis]|nr:hypothetical protein STCU_02409 [Strigomonas culicis]EPY33542.1 hypothetical protein STCU_02166 [Strigomonas culicis]|eukprot:EPY33219.1 hypothetical protein STCU_02409 [Strigomonas culicis]